MKNSNIALAAVCALILLLCFSVRDAFLGNLKQTFSHHTLPGDYMKLSEFLNTNDFSRGLWVPAIQRYGFHSTMHPSVNANDLFSAYDMKSLDKQLPTSVAERLIRDSSISYIVIPDDTEGELFVQNRKYDDSQYREAIGTLDSISWLHRKITFGKIMVYEVAQPSSHFSFASPSAATVQAKMINPTEYVLNVHNVQKGDQLIFREIYDTHWQMSDNGNLINAGLYDKLFMTFILPRSGSYSVPLKYEPQQLLNRSMLISISALVSAFALLVLCYIWKKEI